jgi:hypothetical protein
MWFHVRPCHSDGADPSVRVGPRPEDVDSLDPRYRREGLQYEHWVSGEIVDVVAAAMDAFTRASVYRGQHGWIQ